MEIIPIKVLFKYFHLLIKIGLKPKNLKKRAFDLLIAKSKIKQRGNTNRALIIFDHY